MPLLTSTSYKIVYDDARQHLTVNGRKLHLGHMEYLVARSLVARYDEWKARQCEDRLVSISVLCQVTGTTSVRTLHHIVSDVRGKLLPHDVTIKSVRGDGYYLELPKRET